MVDVFISYAREDRGRVAVIARALKTRGLEVWWEPDSLPSGQYAARIDALLAQAKAIIVVWTHHSANRAWVRDEADFALKRNVYVPVTIGPVDPPHGFEIFGAADLTDWPSARTEGAFDKIVAALTPLREAPAPEVFDEPERPHIKRKRRAALIASGALALAAVAGFAVAEFAPRFMQSAASARAAETEEIRNGPGAAELYGLSPAQLTALTPQELIASALTKTDIDTIERDARAGDRLGRTLLCLSRSYGEGLPKNLFIARETCEAAANEGDGLAIYQISLFMRSGDAGFEESARDADRELQRAVDAGDPRAMTDKAHIALFHGKKQDALALLERAADRGYGPARVQLAALEQVNQVAAAAPPSNPPPRAAAEASPAAAPEPPPEPSQTASASSDLNLPPQ